jgi:hypothetical protein
MNAVLATGAIVVATWAVLAVASRLPRARAPAPPPAGSTDELGKDVDRVERVLAMASTHAGEAHWRLRPMVREIAAAGLRRHGIDLDDDADRARALLAPVTWELVRPERPRPEDPFAPGLGRAATQAIVDDLESLMT